MTQLDKAYIKDRVDTLHVRKIHKARKTTRVGDTDIPDGAIVVFGTPILFIVLYAFVSAALPALDWLQQHYLWNSFLKTAGLFGGISLVLWGGYNLLKSSGHRITASICLAALLSSVLITGVVYFSGVFNQVIQESVYQATGTKDGRYQVEGEPGCRVPGKKYIWTSCWEARRIRARQLKKEETSRGS